MSLPAVTCCQHGALRRRSKGREITGMDALGLPALPKPRLPPAMGARPRACSAHTAPVTPRVYRPHTSTANGQHTHTAPRRCANTFTLVFREAQGRSLALTDRCLPPQRCPPRPAPLTWAGRRRAGSRRRVGGRAGGAAAPPSYGTGRDRTGQPRRRSPATYPCARPPSPANLFRPGGGSVVELLHN